MQPSSSLRKIKVALDWTANTTHAALLAAHGKGFFEEEGLDVSFVEPTQAGAPSTPLQGVVDGDITFGIAPCDDVLSEHLASDRVICIATIAHTDISAVCVLEQSPISSPKLLAGCKYGSCGYPLEVACINSLIAADGGDGHVKEVCPDVRVHTELLLLAGEVDCAWMYRTWEVLRAKRSHGIQMREFRPSQCGVPFGYMNTVIVLRSLVATDEGRDLVKRFLSACSRGASYVASDASGAGALLASMSAKGIVTAELGTDADFNTESIRMLIEMGALCPYDSEEGGQDATNPQEKVVRRMGRWGEMDIGRWANFIVWAFSEPVIRRLKLPKGPDALNLSALYTNEFLP